jgi:hypothetical protein
MAITTVLKFPAIQVWCGDGWLCVIGLKDSEVWWASWPPLTFRVLGQVERLDLGYDPGGMHSIEWDGLDDGVLLVWEFGLARITTSGSILWQRRHDEYRAWAQEISNGIVWMRAEWGRFGFRLADGTPVVE